MDPNLPLVPDVSGVVSVPPPPYESLLDFKPAAALGLRPLWVGMLLTVAGFLMVVLLAAREQASDIDRIAAVWAVPAFVYYFMMVHRIVRVLDSQVGWTVKYTPAAAVWNHFVPIYALYFFYRWPRDVESYINWRLGERSRAGLWSFVGLLSGFLVHIVDPFVGLALIMGSVSILYVPLRRALAVDATASGHDGSLGLGLR